MLQSYVVYFVTTKSRVFRIGPNRVILWSLFNRELHTPRLLCRLHSHYQRRDAGCLAGACADQT
jgi:hypothetical protein